MFIIYWPPCWRTKEVLQHGGSILGSVIWCGTFRQISQLWDDTHTLNLENCLLYLLSTISQLFYFVRCIVCAFIFYCVTAHTLYILSTLDQFWYIKIQGNTIPGPQHEVLSNEPHKLCSYIPQSLILRSIFLGWILIYQNWPIIKFNKLWFTDLWG